MQDGGAKNKKYKNPQDGRVKNKADKRAVLLDKIKTGPLSSESYEKQAEYSNWTYKPRMQYGAVDKERPSGKHPVWQGPSKSNYSKGGSSKSIVKKQVGGFATNKNTISEKEMKEKQKYYNSAEYKKEVAKAKKNIKNATKLKVTKGPWFKKGGTVNTKNKK